MSPKTPGTMNPTELHSSHLSPSCLNRDEVSAPKAALFSSVTRACRFGQCL